MSNDKKRIKCDFGIKVFNLHKRSNTDVERAPRPTGGGGGKGKGKNTVDVTPPTISEIIVGTYVNGAVQVSWKTNEESVSTLDYGTTTGYGTTKSSSGTTYHTVSLSPLVQGTLYNFRINATDLKGNITHSANQTFTAGTSTNVADNVLYLEFYGTAVSNTMWNTSGTITAAHSGLSTAEVEAVIATMKLHYAPFNILVTDDINIYNAAPIAHRGRIIFTESWEWYGQAGGVAYINSFGWSDNAPAFVFTSLLNYNTHNIAEAGAHEGGHMMGCEHQVTCQNGVVTSSYNWGDGITAPIMGASYNVPLGDWWIGPSSYGCTYIQDDTAVIAAKIGLAQ